MPKRNPMLDKVNPEAYVPITKQMLSYNALIDLATDKRLQQQLQLIAILRKFVRALHKAQSLVDPSKGNYFLNPTRKANLQAYHGPLPYAHEYAEPGKILFQIQASANKEWGGEPTNSKIAMWASHNRYKGAAQRMFHANAEHWQAALDFAVGELKQIRKDHRRYHCKDAVRAAIKSLPVIPEKSRKPLQLKVLPKPKARQAWPRITSV